MKIGFLFPGQGSQAIGMGKDIYDNYESVRNTYKKVEDITGIDIAKISFEDQEKLNETKYTQLAILTMSLAILEILKEKNIKAEVSTGLSLGEYTALMYSNAISFEEGIKLVQKRGEYMQELAPKGEWAMSAIIGLTEEQVEQSCKEVQQGFVVPVNFNCPGQIVISGDKSAVEEAANLSKIAGAKRAMTLNTSGPFHTNKLTDASNALKKELDNITINNFGTQVVKNIDGTLYSNKDNVKEILTNHITNPVRFKDGLETMISMGVDTFIEIGPGKTLSGFVKRMPNSDSFTILNINNITTLENVINTIK